MARVKRGNVARKRRNKILRLARGFRGGNGTLFRTANQRVMKALCNAYRDRRRRKRDFRRLWIARINAAARLNGVSYSRLMGKRIPAGAAFAADALGFLDERSLQVHTNDPWLRLTAAHGYVLVKFPTGHDFGPDADD